jgi:DNA-directed RNA polymerase sigma subunit (sigma70/sigma32)
MTTLQARYRESGRDGLTLQEIASMMDLTKERVRQIETKALIKLRRKLQGAQLGPYSPYEDSL